MMVGCHLCDNHGCDDCFEAQAEMVTGGRIKTCINCGKTLLGKSYGGLCKICMQEDRKIPLAVKQEGGNGSPPTFKNVGIRA
jgi:hypothetical protein